jgi:hypothetical protein
MAVNRYTTVDWSAPTSSYIPKPFEQMMMVGKTMQKEHADKQTEADALANEINKIKVANEVISEGSGDDLGIKSRSTGYGEFKNEVLNKYTQANKQLSEDYQAGKLDSNQFSQKVNQLKNDFSGDYQKLKIAEANSAAIEESDKKYREAKHAGANPFVLNELAAEGARLRENPFQTSYKGAPIADFVDSQKALNDYAGNYQKQILNSGSGKRDKFGNIDYSSVSGVTKKRIKEGVTSTFDNDAIGIQTKSQVTRILRDQGLDWNSEVPLKDGTKVKAGDYYYNHMKQDFIDGVVAKAESSDLSKSISKDWMFERDLDKQDAEETTSKNTWNLYAQNANPDPSNAVAKALHEANPNSAFKVNSSGEVEDVKEDELGVKRVVTYKDNSGKVWNPQNPPSQWKFYKDEKTFKIDHPDIAWKGGFGEDRGVFISSGGTEVSVPYNLKPEYKKISNTDVYAKQVSEVFQWAASTGQYVKDKPSDVQYKELLPKYKTAIKNGSLNSAYIPQFDAETAANFKETFAPKVVTTSNGTTVKDPGLVSNWVIDGVSNNEEKMKILNNFNPIGLDLAKSGSNLLISSEDGKEYSVNMNNPTLKSTFNSLTKFIKANNIAKINPVQVDTKDVMKTTSAYLTNLANESINFAQQNGFNPTDAQNQVMEATSSYVKKANNLKNTGYVPTSTYKDPSTGTIAVSYINHSTPGGQDVKVLKFHPGVDQEFEEISEATFTREVEQKALGAFAANLNTKGSKTTGSFIENQKPTK